jgi:hypothetical protein
MNAPKAVKIPRVCGRCGRRLSSSILRQSMACLSDGYVKSVICPECLTAEECADMLLKEVSTECGLNIRDGRILFRSKRFDTQRETEV